MQVLVQLIKKYDPATVFVSAATIVVCIELALMRLLVPAPTSASAMSEISLVEQVCTKEGIAKSDAELQEWSLQTERISGRFLQEPQNWQKELVSLHAFGEVAIDMEHAVYDVGNQRSQYIAAADYAAENLYLQSVMSGRTKLANINGNIYREGDTISMRGGEILMEIIELGSTYAIIQLAQNDKDGDTLRTIYLANNTKLANGERVP